jgi:hypothetical protein
VRRSAFFAHDGRDRVLPALQCSTVARSAAMVSGVVNRSPVACF